jgi:hypothetical protein
MRLTKKTSCIYSAGKLMICGFTVVHTVVFMKKKTFIFICIYSRTYSGILEGGEGHIDLHEIYGKKTHVFTVVFTRKLKYLC